MSEINYSLLEKLSKKKHPLLNIADDFEQQLRSLPTAWIGEVFREARTAHHLLDMAGIPHGSGYAQDLDSRVFQATVKINQLEDRLARLATWHSRETGPGGLVGDYCIDCGYPWPCETRRMADGTYVDPP